MQLTLRMKVYATLAVAGLVVPWYFNLQFMRAAGGPFALGAFVAGGYANPAAASLTSDLTVGATAFLIWMLAEARRLGMRYAWVYAVLLFGVAFAFACPLFLLMRERHLHAASPQGNQAKLASDVVPR